jgi:hypothetical protein
LERPQVNAAVQEEGSEIPFTGSTHMLQFKYAVSDVRDNDFPSQRDIPNTRSRHEKDKLEDISSAPTQGHQTKPVISMTFTDVHVTHGI